MAATAPCQFFSSPSGCNRGTRCRFAHVDGTGSTGAKTTAKVAAAVQQPTTPTAATPITTKTSGPADTPGTQICVFFNEGNCSRGARCRFTHDKSKKSSANETTKPMDADSSDDESGDDSSSDDDDSGASSNSSIEHANNNTSSDSDDDGSSSEEEAPPPHPTQTLKRKAVPAGSMSAVPPPAVISSAPTVPTTVPVSVTPVTPVVPHVVQSTAPVSEQAPDSRAAKRSKVETEANGVSKTDSIDSSRKEKVKAGDTPQKNDDKKAKTDKKDKKSSTVLPFDLAAYPQPYDAIGMLVYLTTTSPTYSKSYTDVNKGAKGWRRPKNRASIGGSRAYTMLGLDCEMVECADASQSLARVTLVTLGPSLPTEHAPRIVVVDRLVAPNGRVVTDYRHKITGLDKSHFEKPGCLPSVEAARELLLKYISRDCVLVGHGLNNDLEALRLKHDRIIDTSQLFACPLKHQLLGLKDIVLQVLKRDCQPAGKPHDSIEDAASALDLVRAVIDKADVSLSKRTNESLLAALRKASTIDIPDHYKLRMQIHQLPEGADLDNVKVALGVQAAHKISARPITFRKAKIGAKSFGSTIFTFESVADVTAVFAALSPDGMKNDADDVPQKKVYLDRAKYPGLRHFWVKVYLPLEALPAATPSAKNSSSTPSTLAASTAPAAVSATKISKVVCPACEKVVPFKAFCCECGSKF